MFKKELKPKKKSEITKNRLYEVAVNQFSEAGFDNTTMRGIAREAGIAPGAIYYHFDSKESLIFEYYKQSHQDHLEALGNYFQQEKRFAHRLYRFLATKIEVAQPYKKLARALFRVAANPDSPMSPFSKTSEKLRGESLAICRELVEGSEDSFHPEVKKLLPEYLWLFQMGVILFWIYDNSPDGRNTVQLIERTVPMIDSLNQMVRSPFAKPFRQKIISLLKEFKPQLISEFA